MTENIEIATATHSDVLELVAEMEIDILLQQDQLTLAQLKELERGGYITRAIDWADWLNPTVPWIAPTEYGTAFQGLTAMGDYE